MRPRLLPLLASGVLLVAACTAGRFGAESPPTARSSSTPPTYDVVIREGTIYDGSGGAPFVGDVAIVGDSVVAVGNVGAGRGKSEVDARGMAVAPGFINMLSWANESLLVDPRAQSDVRQGVTLEVMGEGWSMGPLTDSMKAEMIRHQGDLKYGIDWTTLGGYLGGLERKGVSVNVASFVGATTVRIHELGYVNRAPTPAELERMRGLVRQAMQEGALGVGSALIYAPGTFAKTDELVALANAAAPYHGMYITHMRSEADRLLEAIDETIRISREAGVPAEIYHLKAAGRANWGKVDSAVARIERARAQGLRITANMYTYTAGAAGLNAAMPTWVQEGGQEAWQNRLKDPAIRQRVAREMDAPGVGWENMYLASGGADGLLLVDFKTDSLKRYTGKTLAEVARLRGQSPEEAAMDLVVHDGSEVGTVFFMISEDNVRRQLALPWISFGSDAGAPSAEGVFLKSADHPRAYGNFARLLGRYVREQHVMTLAEAVRRLTSLPATNLGIRRRGMLRPGYYADVVIFDPATITDHATFENPHQYATGVRDVFVNGVQVLRGGEHTGAKPGRFVRGPGWTGWSWAH